jgi:hypothetical protein
MKRVGVISTAILFLLLGTTVPAYAQQEQQGKGQQGKEQGKSQPGQQHQQAKPAPQQHQQRLRSLRNLWQNRNRATAASITAASSPPALPMGASTKAASHSTKRRCAAVSASLAPVRGITTTALGVSAAAITATAYLRNASGSTLAVTTTSACTAFRWSL